MQLADRVLRTVRSHGMIPRGGRVLIALSGGPDSVALTLVLRELEKRGELEVAGLAHLNHGLRDTAGEDEAFCRNLARSLDIPIVVEGLDVRALARERSTSVEDAGRRARYAFFERAAVALGADVVATGHTRDDQAETVLLRLLRGAGPRGLAGILPVSGRVVRPLLEIRREEIEEYLAARNQHYCVDETNLDRSIPRNRVRHELIPYLRREYLPGIVDVLAREATIARQDEDRLSREAIDSLDSIVLKKDGGEAEVNSDGRKAGVQTVEIDVKALASLHPAIASRVVRLLLTKASDRFIGFETVERFLEFAREGPSGGTLALPGCEAVRRGDRIVVSGKRPEPFSNSFRVPLSIPGEVVLDAQGWHISAQPLDSAVWPTQSWKGRGPVVGVAAPALMLPLAVRSRRRGDSFRPLGLGGRRKKLQDFLVDRKIARERRDTLPLVVDGADRIVWVVGESVAEDFRVTEPSQGVILLKARRLGGQG